MSIYTSTTIEVSPDPDYRYTAVAAFDEFALNYVETSTDAKPLRIAFASAAEMKAVAHAMLRAVKTQREQEEQE